jgi:nitrite reductase/ring-hydroxylating ferredoxin subunit
MSNKEPQRAEGGGVLLDAQHFVILRFLVLASAVRFRSGLRLVRGADSPPACNSGIGVALGARKCYLRMMTNSHVTTEQLAHSGTGHPGPAAGAGRRAAGGPGTRRGFFCSCCRTLCGSFLAAGFTSLVVTHVMWLLGLVRFMFPNILIEAPTKFKVGLPEDYAAGQVDARYIAEHGVWIVRHEYEGRPQIYALRAVCTHLGCTPNWLETEQKFKCPCHGSGFYKDGINFEGPAPRPLERYAIHIAADGQLEVDKSKKYQEELGQWLSPDCFVEM